MRGRGGGEDVKVVEEEDGRGLEGGGEESWLVAEEGEAIEGVAWARVGAHVSR